MAEGPIAAKTEPAPRGQRPPGTPMAKAPEDTSPDDDDTPDDTGPGGLRGAVS